MEFPESYFEDEVREGFYVPSIMKKNWAAQLEVLEAVKKVCRENNITYFAEWGTMLGAVRHGGMIPWDDDIDICMKRKDYERFMQVAESELPEEFYVMSYQNSESMNMVTRVQNSKYPIISAEQMKQFHGFPYSMGIDLFVVDSLPKDRKRQQELHELAYSIAQVNTRLGAGNISAQELNGYLCDIERACQVSINRSEPIGPQLIAVTEKLFGFFAGQPSEELTAISIWLNDENYRLPQKYYEECIPMKFENTEIHVPVEYEALLQKKFSNYMTPVRVWESHNYPGYQHQIDTAKEAGIELLEYCFSKSDLEEAERLPKITLKARVMEFVPLLQEAHRELGEMQEREEWNAITGLLGDCQNVAVQLGGMIEELGEGTVMVSVLENYCEKLFGIHECVGMGEKAELDSLEACMADFLEAVGNEIEEKREVVFIPYKAEFWKMMYALWQEEMAREDTDVYVMPAPYYYKDVFGNAKKEMQYEKDGYSTEVELLFYEDYNFEVRHPDRIYIQCPYDEYNYAMTIHPFFYAKNLRKYTEELVYVPGLRMDEITPQDARARKMLKYYCNMPGVVLSDRVVVQSERMREVYVELLTEFAGEETKEIWEGKIVGADALQIPSSGEESAGLSGKPCPPEEWLNVIEKQNGERKKIVLYTTSASALCMSGMKAVEKIKKVMQTFRENEEVALIWRPDSNAKNMLRKRNSSVWQAYRDLMQDYRESGFGILDDTSAWDLAVSLCDACYGDGGVVMNCCRDRGKPVMVQNVDC